MKSVAFHFCPKNHHAYGILMIEIMSPRTFKNRPIWSHWRRKIDVGAVSRKGRRLKRKFAVSRFCKENRKHFSIFLLDKIIYLQFLFWLILKWQRCLLLGRRNFWWQLKIGRHSKVVARMVTFLSYLYNNCIWRPGCCWLCWGSTRMLE